jgi:hypothetical protein
MKNILFISLFSCIFLEAKAFEDPEVLTLEIKKNYSFNYATLPGSSLEINNKFGNVTVQFGPARAIHVEVDIIVNAVNKSLAEMVMDQINIEGSKSSSVVKIQTVLEDLERLTRRDTKVKYEINYTVTMPANMPLTLSNSFGKVIIPAFSAPLSLNLNHCNLIADDVLHSSSKLNLNYGKAQMQVLNGTDIVANYTSFSAQEMKHVFIVDHHSDLKAKIIEDMKGTLNYSSGVFDMVKDGLKLKLNYTKNFKLEQIDSQIKNVEIVSNFSDIALPLSKTFNGGFNIKTLNGTFFIDPDMLIKFQKNTQTDNTRSGKPQAALNVYQGNIGKNSNDNLPKIIVISNYGDVKIKD